jgi:hypothetical protein
MTTYTTDTPDGRKYLTVGHLIYRVKDGALQTFGLYQTHEAAEADLSHITRKRRPDNPFGLEPDHHSGWHIADVTFNGWGVPPGPDEPPTEVLTEAELLNEAVAIAERIKRTGRKH